MADIVNNDLVDDIAADAAAAAAAAAATDGASTEDAGGLLAAIFNEIFGSYINMALVALIGFLLYKILRGRSEEANRRSTPPPPQLPKLRRDFTAAELKAFDGTQPDGRVLMAVNGTVYDVTKGKSFYGPGGPYAAFAGRDASRGLATFSVTAADDDKYDDLSDLSKMEMDSVREWEMQFNEKYLVVGKLLKPGELHNSYSDEEDEKDDAKTPIVSLDGGESNATAAVNRRPKADDEKASAENATAEKQTTEADKPKAE